MSCDFRICSDTAVFGQPETGLGITPGFGGTQRLAHLVGPGMAKQMIYTARNIKADKRPIASALSTRSIRFLTSTPRRKSSPARSLATRTIAVRASKQAINDGLQVDIDRAVVIEEKSFGSCFQSADQRRAWAPSSKSASTSPLSTSDSIELSIYIVGIHTMKVAVFGAGTMGSGIAQVFAAKGHTALMYASTVASAQKHKDKLAASLQKRVEKGKMTEEAVDAMLANVLVEEKSAGADADLIIECGKENMATKKSLLTSWTRCASPRAIFATNTSSLSVTEMGHGLKHPVIGMHFFNPVPSMKLVEVIRGANTTQETFDFIYNLSQEIGKEPRGGGGPRLRRQQDPDPYDQRGHRPGGDRRCLCGRYRHGHAAGREPPHGPPGSGRLHRPGRVLGYHGCALQRDPRQQEVYLKCKRSGCYKNLGRMVPLEVGIKSDGRASKV